MSLRYGVGGATAALGVIGACKSNKLLSDCLKLTFVRYAIHWRRGSFQCEFLMLED